MMTELRQALRKFTTGLIRIRGVGSPIYASDTGLQLSILAR